MMFCVCLLYSNDMKDHSSFFGLLDSLQFIKCSSAVYGVSVLEQNTGPEIAPDGSVSPFHGRWLLLM